MPTIAFDEKQTQASQTTPSVQMASIVSPTEVVAQGTKAGLGEALGSFTDTLFKFGHDYAVKATAQAKLDLAQKQTDSAGVIVNNLLSTMDTLNQREDLNDVARSSIVKMQAWKSIYSDGSLSVQEKMGMYEKISKDIEDHYHAEDFRKNLATTTDRFGNVQVNDGVMRVQNLTRVMEHIQDYAKYLSPEQIGNFMNMPASEQTKMLGGVMAVVAKGKNLEETLTLKEKETHIALQQAQTGKVRQEISDGQNKRKTEETEAYLNYNANNLIANSLNTKDSSKKSLFNVGELKTLIERLSTAGISDTSPNNTIGMIAVAARRGDKAVIKGVNNYQAKLRNMRAVLEGLTTEHLTGEQAKTLQAAFTSDVLGSPGSALWVENVRAAQAGKFPAIKTFSNTMVKNAMESVTAGD